MFFFCPLGRVNSFPLTRSFFCMRFPDFVSLFSLPCSILFPDSATPSQSMKDQGELTGVLASLDFKKEQVFK